ncbi:hypothetical protein [Azospirillum sp. B506]|uniref:hypothetical protein n=1 Tax=Azospirillum sp. B506 TaxID=137721 RepID=UPI00034A354D|nr:hypothetical protein [Azospirillum sp. B506]
MTNPYFNHDNPESKRTLARAESINAAFEAVAAGFDLLPDDLAMKQGRVTWAIATGGPVVYVVTLPFDPPSYASGLSFRFKVPVANNGPCAINVTGPTGLLGTKALKRFNGTDTLPNDLVTGSVADVSYDGSKFVLVGQHGATETVSATNAATSTAQAIIATNKATEAQGYASSAGNSATAALGYANAAGAAAAGVNMPTVGAADAGKGIEVKPDGSGWRLASFLKSIGGTLTGWLQTYAGTDSTNLGLRIGEATSGFYRSALGVIGFVVNGIEVFRTAANGTLTFRTPVVPRVVTVPWAATIALDLTVGNKFKVTLGGGTTFGPPTLTDDMEGMEFTIIPMQDATGNRAVAFDSLFRFPAGVAPIPSAAAGKRDRAICEVVKTAAGTLAIDAVYVKGF